MSSYFVDVVDEDSFYENLLLGVTRVLESNPCVKKIELERKNACDRSLISAWEQKHCCLLTEDLRNFYTSTDGFVLTWSLEIAGEEFRIGRMEIKELSNLKRHVNSGNVTFKENDCSCTCCSNNTTTTTTTTTSLIEPSFESSSRCKLFELAECTDDDCKVFLVYQLQLDQDEPSVWLYSCKKANWHRLADNFLKYFRMMLAHLGLPLWQTCAAGLRLPTWIEQVYLLVGPHLLSVNDSSNNYRYDGPINVIDPMIFREKEQQEQSYSNKQKTKSSIGNNVKKKSSVPIN